MNTINVATTSELLKYAAKSLIENEQYLCEMDSYIGDGDHGVTIARGFTSVLNVLQTESFDSLGLLFDKVGTTLIASMGGAIGPLFGSIFTAAGTYCGERREATITDLHGLFAASLQLVKKLGKASEGDRTFVDALSPAVQGLAEASSQQLSLSAGIRLAAERAEIGAESTKEMMAKKGRARFLGEKSIGYRDAGASSIVLFFTAMADFIEKSDR